MPFIAEKSMSDFNISRTLRILGGTVYNEVYAGIVFIKEA
jgi:hypothetical protein